jgi:hypothetical protein
MRNEVSRKICPAETTTFAEGGTGTILVSSYKFA